MKNRWLSVDKIGASLGIKLDTVYKWISEKAMHVHKISHFMEIQERRNR